MLAVWPLSHQFSAYTWPGPLGWVARDCPGNVAAGFIQVALAGVAATVLWPAARRAVHRFVDRKLGPLHEHLARQAEHRKWEAQTLARLHLSVTGDHADPHPEHGRLTGGPST